MTDKEFEDFMGKLLTPMNISQNIEGKTLKEIFFARLIELDLSQRQAEDLLGLEYKTIMGILNKTTKRVDILVLLKLSQFLGMTTDQIIKIHTAHGMTSDAIGKIESAKKHSWIANHFDLKQLRSSKFIFTSSDIEAIEKRIIKFFGFENIYEYEGLKYFPAFSRTKNKSDNLMREFWVKSAYLHFKKINNQNPYDRDALVDLMPKIRPYTRNEKEGLLTVIRALYKVGVTVIYQPNLPNVQVRGATFVIDGKPCIVLTDIYKRYPTLWFALIHELYHALYDYEELEKQTYHLTGEADILLSEDDANAFAKEYLFSKENMQYILPFIEDDFLVRDYAHDEELHPSIIYSFYNREMELKGDRKAWMKQRYQNFPDIREAVKSINTNLWDGETIEESVKQIKETVFQNL